MNLSEWPYSLYPNYYSYSYNTSLMLNSSIGTSLNSSSGYESGSNDTSLIEPCFINPLSIAKKEQSNAINDYEIDIDGESIDYDNNYRQKKCRVLSRSQRKEANRRERHRMEIINQAYERLRNFLPFKKGRKRKKMSRIDTVDGAIEYIQSLLEILYGPNYNSEFAKI